jgi:hypothetical protein
MAIGNGGKLYTATSGCATRLSNRPALPPEAHVNGCDPANDMLAVGTLEERFNKRKEVK